MNSRILAVTAVLLSGVTLGGCLGSSEAGGTVGGAVIGGLIGNQFGRGGGRVAATVGGAVIGGLLGGAIGRDLDDREREAAHEAQLVAVRSGRPERWTGRPGYYGYVEPGVAAEGPRGYCREYSHTVYIEGRPARGSGIACRQPDGGWAIVN